MCTEDQISHIFIPEVSHRTVKNLDYCLYFRLELVAIQKKLWKQRLRVIKLSILFIIHNYIYPDLMYMYACMILLSIYESIIYVYIVYLETFKGKFYGIFHC